ncbi:hypothetical protein RCL_jg13314.t1 [Rhizophagus clarus]|uniref:Uncharacterized protein n=1 Tax=Rhizophagus clarus TaxID=94130 RepID=A0A8H3LQ65_9GLOM|nr:hypothetical protein RCL_jg13314.t1 [Rhizophagus clarus]
MLQYNDKRYQTNISVNYDHASIKGIRQTKSYISYLTIFHDIRCGFPIDIRKKIPDGIGEEITTVQNGLTIIC